MGCATSAAADKYADSGRGETTSTDKVIIKTRRGREFINQYQLGDVLGQGAFGVVRHARCKTRLGGRAEAGAGSQRRFEDFAIKMLSKPRLKRNRVGLRKSALDLLAQEIAVWKKLDHPNVCNLIEVINDPHHDEVFLVSEFVRGGTLLQDKRNVEVLPESRCKHYFRQILKGLAYLHRNNVAHRDIKPANIMLTDRSDAGVVKLVDFGVADMWDGVDGADEKAGFVKNTVGTMEFFSPEMCKEGGASFDVKLCDVWAAGVTLHLMVAGRLPSIAQSMEELFHKIINDKSPSLRDD